MAMDDKIFSTLMEMKGQLGGIDEKLDDLKTRRLDHENRIAALETVANKIKSGIAFGGLIMIGIGAVISDIAKNIAHKLGWS